MENIDGSLNLVDLEGSRQGRVSRRMSTRYTELGKVNYKLVDIGHTYHYLLNNHVLAVSSITVEEYGIRIAIEDKVAAATLSRQPKERSRSGSIDIPAGQIVTVSMFAMHHNPDIFPDPGIAPPPIWFPKTDGYVCGEAVSGCDKVDACIETPHSE